MLLSKQFGRPEIRSKLGAGGMGEKALSINPQLPSSIDALKKLKGQ